MSYQLMCGLCLGVSKWDGTWNGSRCFLWLKHSCSCLWSSNILHSVLQADAPLPCHRYFYCDSTRFDYPVVSCEIIFFHSRNTISSGKFCYIVSNILQISGVGELLLHNTFIVFNPSHFNMKLMVKMLVPVIFYSIDHSRILSSSHFLNDNCLQWLHNAQPHSTALCACYASWCITLGKISIMLIYSR